MGRLPARQLKLKAIEPLFIESSGGDLLASSPRLDSRLRLSFSAAKILLGARSPIKVNGASVGPGLRTLYESGFLVEVSDSASPDQGAPQPWREWGSLAWEFHKRTSDIGFLLRGSEEESRWLQQLEVTEAPPPRHKEFRDVPILLLPRVRSNLSVPLGDVLDNRRTCRQFLKAPISLDAFSTLLHYTLGPVRFAHGREMGVLELRANVSGGARHETAGYVAVFDVENVEPGLYYYEPIQQGLIELRSGELRDDLERLTYSQQFFSAAAFGLVTVADARRMSWKYRHGRAYRNMMNNVGAIAQVFSMTSYALGLGAAITGAIADTATAAFLGCRESYEIPTFAMACGAPARDEWGRPSGTEAPTRPFTERPTRQSAEPDEGVSR